MKKYIFIDNWVLGSLADSGFSEALTEYLKINDYIILLTPLSFVELYNPGWMHQKSGDRTQRAAKFLAGQPCVVVDPADVWAAEVENKLEPVSELPVKLDLRELDNKWREESILRFLRADELYLQQGNDIRAWSENHKKAKETWLGTVNKIIDEACEAGNLCRHKKTGELMQLQKYKELFLFSMDFRHTSQEQIDKILDFKEMKMRAGELNCLSSVRLGSLIFWYLYVDVDKANKIKHQSSDIGDLYQLSLLPYCDVFTVDKSMMRLLERIKEPVDPIRCRIYNKSKLREVVGI